MLPNRIEVKNVYGVQEYWLRETVVTYFPLNAACFGNFWTQIGVACRQAEGNI